MTVPEPYPGSPYYPAPAYAPPPPRDLTLLGVLAFATAATSTAFNIGTAAVSGRMVRTYDDPSLDWSVAVYGLGSVLEFVALLAAGILGAAWLHRARRNAELLNPTARHARSAGWAWGGWICPVVALWFPFQVVRDVRRAVTPDADGALVGWWWALYLAMTLSSNLLGGLVDAAETDQAGAVQAVSIVVALVTLVALLLWGRVLWEISSAQHARAFAG